LATIHPDLLAKLKSKTGTGRSQVYRLIERKAQQLSVAREVAAIALAQDLGINTSRFASSQQLAEIRTARGGGVTSAPSSLAQSPPPPTVTISKARKKELKEAKKRGTSVFVVHGRNEKINRAMFGFLRSIGLTPIEWVKALAMTGTGSPYIGEVLDAAFKKAIAVIVLLTPDDQASSKPEFIKTSDPPYERVLTGQPRPNVLFEAGMSFGRHPDNTVLVQVGETRPLSDLAGRHVDHLDGSVPKRQELVIKLRSCGCEVDTTGTHWMTEGDFSL